MDLWRDHYQVIKSFIILAVLRRSAYRVCEAHLCIFAPGQHSSFRRNFAAVSGSWQLSDLSCPKFEPPAPEMKRVTAWPTGLSWLLFCLFFRALCMWNAVLVRVPDARFARCTVRGSTVVSWRSNLSSYIDSTHAILILSTKTHLSNGRLWNPSLPSSLRTSPFQADFSRQLRLKVLKRSG